MIEMELKFRLNAEPNITRTPDEEKFQTDIYYDTADYKLLAGGNFLRVRNGKRIDIKFDLDGIENPEHLYCIESNFNVADIVEKSDSLNSSLTKLGLNANARYQSFDDFTTKNNLIVLAPIVKQRANYRISDDMTISVDRVENMGIFVEAEIMLDADTLSPAEAAAHKANLLKIATDHGFISDSSKVVHTGYVELYLYEHNRPAYDLGKFKM
jgi:adenylate cyclase class IV